MLMRGRHQHNAAPRRKLGQRFADCRTALRFELDDWRQVGLLRFTTAGILAAVSFYYLFQWARDIGMPVSLAWTPPAALDITAFMAVKVARHARDRKARRKASALAWLCVALSVCGQIGAHAFEMSLLHHAEFWMLAATAALYPTMFIAGHVVAGGMAPRPKTVAQQAAAEAARIAADEEVARARDAARAAQAARKRAIAEASPAGVARVTERATPAERPGDQAGERPVSPAGDKAGEETGDPVDQRVSEAHLLELSIAYMRANPDAGRRVLLTHLRETTGLGKGITEYMLKGRPGAPGIHERAKEAAAQAPAEVSAEGEARARVLAYMESGTAAVA